MDRWAGKVAVVTGANSGIGAAIAIDLVKAGLIVFGLDVSLAHIEELKTTLKNEKGKLHGLKCDVTSESSVNEVFAQIEKNCGGVNILVNNAALCGNSTILGPPANMENMSRLIDTNIKGVLYCTRAIDEILMRTGEPGHIVNIGSTACHVIPFLPPPVRMNVYSGTKHAIKAITEVLRQELIARNQKVRVSMICPGSVRTNLLHAAGWGSIEDIFKVALDPSDISQACLFILGMPAHVQIHDIIIKPVGEQL